MPGLLTSTFRSGFFLADFVKKVTKFRTRPTTGPFFLAEWAVPFAALSASTESAFDLAIYYPIILYLVVVVGLCIAILLSAHLIGPAKKTPVKMMPYESGMDPIGDARRRFDIKFYLTAILFLVFDVELLFLYPWAVIAYREPALLPAGLQGPVFWEVLVFLATLAVAYVYAWRKGVFQWR